MTALITMMFENIKMSFVTSIPNHHKALAQTIIEGFEIMPEPNRFAVIGCPKCRIIMSADLSHATKTCQCGNKIDLHKAKLIAIFNSADAAAQAVMQIQGRKNTSFTSATKIAGKDK